MVSKSIISFCIVAMCILGMTQTTQAQDKTHKISLGAGLGFGHLTGDLGKEGSLGFSWNLEGNYFLSDKLSAGLLISSNALIYGNKDALFGASVYGGRLILAKADYFFLTKKFRPFVTLGLGGSIISTPEIEITSGGQTTTIPSEKKFNLAVSPRFGFMLGNFGFEYGYNICGKTPKSEYQNVTSGNKAFNFYHIVIKYVYPFEF
jgi:hypothetical protein